MADFPLELRVLLLHEGRHFVAQCLEYDVAGQGSDAQSALKELARLFVIRFMVAEEKQVDPLADLGPAPRFYQEKWETAIRMPKVSLPDPRPASRRTRMPQAELALV